MAEVVWMTTPTNDEYSPISQWRLQLSTKNVAHNDTNDTTKAIKIYR